MGLSSQGGGCFFVCFYWLLSFLHTCIKCVSSKGKLRCFASVLLCQESFHASPGLCSAEGLARLLNTWRKAEAVLGCNSCVDTDVC